MKFRSFPIFSAFIIGALIVTSPGVTHAQDQATQNDPLEYNPIARSWKFTQNGDYVTYSVLGAEDRDLEVWYCAGRKGDTFIYVVQKQLDGDKVGEPERRTYEYIERSVSQSLADSFISRGYRAQPQSFTNGGQSLPSVQVSNEADGTYAYCEDVPLGGLVKQVHNESGITYQLAKFKRQHEPRPSTIPLKRKEVDESQVEKIGAIAPRPGDRDTTKLLSTVTPHETIIREDADTTPQYFKPGKEATRTSKLDDYGWLISLRGILPNSIARWSVAYYDNLDDEKEKPDYAYDLRMQTESISDEGIIKITRDATKVKGDVPEGFNPEAIGYLIDPKALPLTNNDIQAIYIEKRNVPMKVVGYTYNTTQYLVLETPQITRTDMEGNPLKEEDYKKEQIQDITRVVHRLWVDQPPTTDPLLIKRVTTIYKYDQEGEPLNPSKLERKETRITEDLAYLLGDVDADNLLEFAAPVAEDAAPVTYDELKKDPVMALP